MLNSSLIDIRFYCCLRSLECTQELCFLYCRLSSHLASNLNCYYSASLEIYDAKRGGGERGEKWEEGSGFRSLKFKSSRKFIRVKMSWGNEEMWKVWSGDVFSFWSEKFVVLCEFPILSVGIRGEEDMCVEKFIRFSQFLNYISFSIS